MHGSSHSPAQAYNHVLSGSPLGVHPGAAFPISSFAHQYVSTSPDTSSLAQFEVVGVDTQVGPDGSKVHHSQLSHLAGSVGKELNNEAGLISEGTSSSSLPSLQKEPEKEIAIQSPISGSLQQEPEEETTTQFHVDHSSGSL
ncbi:hypothetical protein V6N13_084023 [Hibiscus sabdariffa]